MKNEMNLMKQENAQKSEEIKKLKEENKEITNRMNEMENFSRLSNLEIHNVPYATNENINRITINLLKIVDPNMNENDIENCFRIRKNNQKEENTKYKPSPILVKFQSMKKRMNIFKNKKKLAEKDFSEIGIEATKVFINENLTPATRSLFYHANVLKKTNNWKYIWTQNGHIKMRKNDNTPILYIKNESDLNKITN